MQKTISSLFALFILLSLSACSVTAKHPTLQSADLPPLIPLRDFIASTKSNHSYKVSPDGKKIAWVAVDGIKVAVHFRTIGSDKVGIIRSDSGIGHFTWAQDSVHLFHHLDKKSNENYHIHMTSTLHPEKPSVDITPFKGVKASLVSLPGNKPDIVFFKHNKRNKSFYDLFKLNLKTKKTTLVSRNPGKVYNWLIDDDGILRGRYLKLNDKKSRLERRLSGSKWEKVLDWKFDDYFHILDFTGNPDELWAISNIGRDKTSLQRFNIKTKKSTFVYADDKVDLGTVYISKVTHQPLFISTSPDYPKKHFFDKTLQKEYQTLKQHFKKYIYFASTDRAERNVVIAVSNEKSASHYLYQRDTGKTTFLGKHHISKYQAILSNTKPISYKSRDGLTIHGYLTMPKGLEGRRVPMVLQVHGGPWSRDYYGLRMRTQFLANRGYAVLKVNYRGSSGYGKKFRDAAVGEFAGKMHNDLIDAVNWAVATGVADKDKVCISGGSYGGYATLVGMTFTPDVFACGVDVVGMSNLVSLIENVPAYWKNYMPFWYKFIGNPNNPKDRKDMQSRSPLFKVAAVKNPLMIVQGANDPRVTQKESDQIVKALRDSGKEVEYLLFKDEGHGIKKWTNNMKFQRKMEDFLAKHLGGRSAGFDYYEIGAMIF